MSSNQDEFLERPLAATLMAEFQNLKDKFKNDDDFEQRGKS